MTDKQTSEDLGEVLFAYGLDGNDTKIEPWFGGLINRSYRIESKGKLYFLQQINKKAFKHPEDVMANMVSCLDYIHRKIREEGVDPSKRSLNLVKTVAGLDYFVSSIDNCWRLEDFIEGASFSKATSPKQIYEAGLAFGKFDRYLSDFPIQDLLLTIGHFHSTPWRYNGLIIAKGKAEEDRISKAQEALEFAMSRKDEIGLIDEGLEDGSMSVRPIHNDTKISNVLFDEKQKAICVIDLDTIMPGSPLFDFADGIRSGASLAQENEKDLEKVVFSLPLFEGFAQGFLTAYKDLLNEKEKSLLFYSCKLITYECGIRFLTDYLKGDRYFRIDYPEENLDRAKNQFALLLDMEKKEAEAQSILKKILE